MNKLPPQEASERLRHLSGWRIDDDRLIKEYIFKDFREAVEFINRIRPLADAMNHHPDLCISYNKVKAELTTHDAGGLTELDFELAKKMDESFNAVH
ncbi:4a-hydroxytetrahydrobiopterin dehydratase [Thermocladium modestius]|uniref:Putative pterin-4-alpha-carbinolamine dehydratase n=1 Tax=Thermocladium modestius TaxID=62609 RepID=A0A830GTQ5_9CREN|nr:4a-hydroxytetrahydrobiopterin dehydratase [Thermocladium modestius]GGP20011.1 4a-hydroxytetrahydrobiopterin dehydratase [Thermocladium modestius]